MSSHNIGYHGKNKNISPIHFLLGAVSMYNNIGIKKTHSFAMAIKISVLNRDSRISNHWVMEYPHTL